jgi:hypothetical protein
VVDHQVAAYHDRDLERFLACYAADVKIKDFDGNMLMGAVVLPTKIALKVCGRGTTDTKVPGVSEPTAHTFGPWAAFLWPCRATSGPTSTHPPRATARAVRRNVSSSARGHGGGPSLLRPHREALQDHGQGRTSSLRCGLSTLTVSLGRNSIGAYRRDGQD